MSQSQAGSLRGLKALVAFLGVLVVLGTAVVVGVVIRRLYAPTWQSANTPAAAFSAPSSSTWKPPLTDPSVLPAGSKITGVAASDGLFAVSISTSHGDELWIINPSTGERSITLSAKP